MTIEKVESSRVEVVIWEEAKRHLRLDSDAEKQLVEVFISASTQAAERYVGYALAETTYLMRLARFPVSDCPIEIPFPRVTAVTDIDYRDADGSDGTVESFTTWLSRNPALIYPNEAWPATDSNSSQAVEVTFKQGASEPQYQHMVGAAILLMVGDLYEHRGDDMGKDAAYIPPAAKRLLDLAHTGVYV